MSLNKMVNNKLVLEQKESEKINFPESKIDHVKQDLEGNAIKE